jgi:hypothetical protein
MVTQKPIKVEKPITQRQKIQNELQSELDLIIEEVTWRKNLGLDIFLRIFGEKKPIQEVIDNIDHSMLSNSTLSALKDSIYIKIYEFLNLVESFDSSKDNYVPGSYDPLRHQWNQLNVIKKIFSQVTSLDKKMLDLEKNPSLVALQRGPRPF